MEETEKIDLLKKNGFKPNDTGEVYERSVEKNPDRFNTDFLVFIDEIDVLYINRYFMSGLETISRSDVMRNHNDMNSEAKKVYVDIKENLSFLKSVI